MNPLARMARMAVAHLPEVPPNERPDLLEEASKHLPEKEAQLCVITAEFIRQSEIHQLTLIHLLK